MSEEEVLQGSVGPKSCGVIQAPGYTFGYCILLSSKWFELRSILCDRLSSPAMLDLQYKLFSTNDS